MRSSSVTSPDTPPYSSTTRQTCTASRFICCSSVSAFIDSGTKTAGRAMRLIGASRQPGLVAEAELHEVLEVEHADDVVGVVVDDRDARDALLEEDRHRARAWRRRRRP